jgi:RNA polymerase sigma-70 factor (ECF subfamily)
LSPGREIPDQVIIADCLAGRVQAYAVLVERYQSKVFNVLYRFLGNREASEDLSQMAFITAYEKLHTFSAKSKFSTWLCQIALNKARDSVRGKNWENECDDLEDYSEQLSGLESDTPHYRVETMQQNAHIQKVLNELPADYREVLILKHLEECSNQEIAEILGLTVENVKVRTFRARQMFKQIYARHI